MAENELVDQGEVLFDPVEGDKHRSDRSLETKEVASHNVDLFADSQLGGLHVGKVGLHGGDVSAHRLENFIHQFVRDLSHYSL